MQVIGLQTVTKLQKNFLDEADITLINKINITTKQLGYMKLGTLNYEDLIYPIESVIKEDKVKFINAEVTKIDRNAKK